MSSQPTDKIAICNLALDVLKQAPIASIDTPQSSTEIICARWYDKTRRELLRKHTWNFAKTRQILTADAATPEFGYGYAFNLPNDYIRLCTIGDDAIDDIRRRYEIEDGQLLIDNDSSSLKISYIYNCEDVTKFDPMFVSCLVLTMANNMATKFSATAAVKTQIKDDLAEIVPWATAVDGQERPPKRIQTSKFLVRRRGGASGVVASPYTVFE